MLISFYCLFISPIVLSLIFPFLAFKKLESLKVYVAFCCWYYYCPREEQAINSALASTCGWWDPDHPSLLKITLRGTQDLCL